LYYIYIVCTILTIYGYIFCLYLAKGYICRLPIKVWKVCCYSLNVITFFKSLNRFFIKVDLIGWYLNINTIKTKKLVHTCKNVRWCRFLSMHTVPFGVGAYSVLVCESREGRTRKVTSWTRHWQDSGVPTTHAKLGSFRPQGIAHIHRGIFFWEEQVRISTLLNFSWVSGRSNSQSHSNWIGTPVFYHYTNSIYYSLA